MPQQSNISIFIIIYRQGRKKRMLITRGPEERLVRPALSRLAALLARKGCCFALAVALETAAEESPAVKDDHSKAAAMDISKVDTYTADSATDISADAASEAAWPRRPLTL